LDYKISKTKVRAIDLSEGVNAMERLLIATVDLATALIKYGLWGAGILLVYGEIKLATIKKLSKGTPGLTSFTERMTGQKSNF